MGDDHCSRMVFAARSDAAALRLAIVGRVTSHLLTHGLVPVPARTEESRNIVVGPPDRWIFVGDSAGTTFSDEPAFIELSASLSTLAPVVEVFMEDSCVLRLNLYRDGKRVDRVADRQGLFKPFASPDEARAYAGRPELWLDLVANPASPQDDPAPSVADWEDSSMRVIRAAWSASRPAVDRLYELEAIFGFGGHAWCGFTNDSEGIPDGPADWNECSSPGRPFTELRFARNPTAA